MNELETAARQLQEAEITIGEFIEISGKFWYDRFEKEIEIINNTDLLTEIQKLKNTGLNRTEAAVILAVSKLTQAAKKASGIS